jgi:peptide/nickel transport system substrate-binding protein
MRRSAALLTTAALLAAAAACSSDNGSSSSGAGAFDPKNCQGGTLYILNQSDPTGHHLDPARIYNSGGGAVTSLIFRTLTTRHRVPGEAGDQVVPDLATDIGEPSDDAKTWTYHLKDGLKFEDGTPITSKDIKWGIERAFAPELPGGIPYLRDWLVGGEDYKGPYKGKELDSIQTPDDKTIVFKLRKPEGDFPYVATATQFAPVPKAKDDGTGYEKHPVSSGPYKVQSHEQDKSLVLVRNPYWSRAVDDQRLACPDRIEGTYGLNAAVINQRLSSSAGKDANAITTDTDLSPAELARITNDPNLKKRAVKGEFGETDYIAFNPKVKPFDDIRVREAIAYAVSRQSVVNAAGGSSLAKAATTFLPDQAAFGYQPYDYFPAGPGGNPAKAKELLAQAGHPNGLTVTLGHRNGRAGRAQAGRHHGEPQGLRRRLVRRHHPKALDRAGHVPHHVGRGLADRRTVPRPDLRRAPDPQGRRQLQRLPAERPEDQRRVRRHQQDHRPGQGPSALGRPGRGDRQAGAHRAADPPDLHPADRQERQERLPGPVARLLRPGHGLG